MSFLAPVLRVVAPDERASCFGIWGGTGVLHHLLKRESWWKARGTFVRRRRGITPRALVRLQSRRFSGFGSWRWFRKLRNARVVRMLGCFQLFGVESARAGRHRLKLNKSTTSDCGLAIAGLECRANVVAFSELHAPSLTHSLTTIGGLECRANDVAFLELQPPLH